MEAERKEHSLVAEAINEANSISDNMDADASGTGGGRSGGTGAARGKAAARGTRAGGVEVQVSTVSSYFFAPLFSALRIEREYLKGKRQGGALNKSKPKI